MGTTIPQTSIHRFTTLILIAALAKAGSLSAQTNAGSTSEVIELEEYEIKGFRSSLGDAISAKREASQVIDTITAEQIGLFGAQNVGEAIQRIAGVSLTRNNGEGESITIRGLAPEFTRVEVDGRSTALTADQAEPGRAVLLSPFSADLYSEIEVVKSPTAADTEGGLGGIVRLSTPDPLKLGRLRWGMDATITDAKLRDNTEPGFKAFYSNVFADKKVGFLISATYEDRDRRLDKVQAGDPVWAQAGSDDPALDGGRYPERLRLESRKGDLPKFNLNSKVQFQVNPELQLYLNGVYTHEERTEDRSRIQVEFSRGTFQGGTIDTATGTLTSAQFTRQRVDYNDFTRETVVGSLGVTAGLAWERDLWQVEARVSTSDGEEDFDEYQAQARINRDGAGGYDLGDDPRTPSLDTESLSLDRSDIPLRGINDNKRIISIGENEFQADAARRLESALFKSIAFGVRAASTEFDRKQGGPPSAPTEKPDGSAITFADGVTPFVLDGTFGFGNGGDDFLTTWPEVDAKEMYFRYAPSGPVVFDNDRLYTVTEDNLAGYVMTDFDGSMGEALFRGNVGVRVVKTDYSGNGRVTLTSAGEDFVLDDEPALEADYTKALPAFNLTLQPNAESNILIRGAITRALTRPTVGQIAPNTEINADDLEVARGNPALDPFLAWQYDLGIEYYFGATQEGLISVTGFIKDVENFIVPSITTETFAFPEFGVPAQEFTLSTFENGGKASVQGLELNLQTPFTFLPGFLANFGGAANYTYTDSEFTDANGNTFSFPGASKNTYNLVLYYEQGGFSTRLAYNYRDEYLDTPSGFTDGSNARYGDAQGRLDFSVRYRFENGLRLSFDALNITGEQSYRYYDIPQRYQNFEFEDVIYTFGVGYSF